MFVSKRTSEEFHMVKTLQPEVQAEQKVCVCVWGGGGGGGRGGGKRTPVHGAGNIDPHAYNF